MNIAILSYQTNYERMRATLVRLLLMPVARNVKPWNVSTKGAKHDLEGLIWLDLDEQGYSLHRLTQNTTRVKQSPTTSWAHHNRNIYSLYHNWYVWNYIEYIKHIKFVSFSRIRVDARKRNESAYVWTRKLLYPEQNVCGYKRIRIRVDRTSVLRIGSAHNKRGHSDLKIWLFPNWNSGLYSFMST